MKYILIILLTILSVYPQVNESLNPKAIMEWLRKHPWKRAAFWVAIGIGLWAAIDLWCDARINDANREEDKSTIRQLTAELSHAREEQRAARGDLREAREELKSAHENIAQQNKLLVEQERSIIAQTRTIGSIAYNTQTTFDGKQRFIRCFKDLSRLTALKDEGARFEGLVCDDGVAMYWFDPKSDLPTGFHFFPNDELNRVLSGIPVDENVVDSSGRLTIPADSELSIALNEALSRRTPSLPVSTSGPMKERTDDAIIAELTTLFRYVYRAESSQFTLAYFKGTHKTDGTRSLMFQYLVDPFAENPHLRTVSGFMLTPAFMKSLYGVTIADFSQLVIAECNRLGIEPKIRLSDVCQLNAIRALDERKHNSPFRQLHKEGK